MCVLLGETQGVFLRAFIGACGMCVVYRLGWCFCAAAVSVLSAGLMTWVSGRDLRFFCPRESLPARPLP